MSDTLARLIAEATVLAGGAHPCAVLGHVKLEQQVATLTTQAQVAQQRLYHHDICPECGEKQVRDGKCDECGADLREHESVEQARFDEAARHRAKSQEKEPT